MANVPQMIIREICWQTDGERLSNFDASFSTEYIYRIVVSGMSVEIIEAKLDVPFRKTYQLDCVKNDVEASDYSVAAEIEGFITGFATVKYEAWNKRAVLTGIYVAPESRGKGVGRALIDSVINYAKTTPARCLWLETQNINYPAIRFYIKMGFRFCGFDKSLYNPVEVSSDETAFYFYKNIIP